MLNSKGQAVFIGGFIGLMSLILFVLLFPIISDFVAIGIAGTNNALAQLFIYSVPYFLLVFIIWGILAFMRGGA